MGRKPVDMVGRRYGSLTVLYRLGSADGCVIWRCRCDCGNERDVRGQHLRQGLTTSCKTCGTEARRKVHTIHGLRNKTPLYTTWCNMRRRCSDESTSSFDVYGGRGIRVCEEWMHDFKAFYDWAMENGYEEGLSIDRVDVDGDYSPDNCRWATAKQQANNTRRNVLIDYEGETHTMHEWADILGIPYKTLWNRIHSGWSVYRAFNQPLVSNHDTMSEEYRETKSRYL